MNIQPRNIGLAILFSIITFGIYGIYWFIKLTDETNQLSGDQQATSGGIAFLLTLVTCGIYGFYWAYKQGERLAVVRAANGRADSNLSVIYLILSIFGLSIVAYALMQDEINKAVSNA